MMDVQVYQYDAFTKTAGKGNPAGIVLDNAELTDAQMQQIAKEVGFNECAFPVGSEKGDLRIRFFTPGHEMPLCGHATMATMTALLEHGQLPEKDEYLVETLAGLLKIGVRKVDGTFYIHMEHAEPKFVPFHGSKEDLAASIGINASDIHPDYPIVYGSTGTWTLIIPIARLEAFEQMKPESSRFPEILTEMPKASLHPFGFQTLAPDADLHARHFSSPFSGTVEDPVTGTGSGVMGAYMAAYVHPEKKGSYDLVVEQGQEIGKDGRVIVHVHNEEEVRIAITGIATYAGSFALELEETEKV